LTLQNTVLFFTRFESLVLLTFIFFLFFLLFLIFSLSDEDHPRVLNAKKYLLKNKVLLNAATTTNQSQPSKIVKKRAQTKIVRSFGNEGGEQQLAESGGMRTRKQVATRPNNLSSPVVSGARAQNAASQRGQKKSLARLAQQQHQQQLQLHAQMRQQQGQRIQRNASSQQQQQKVSAFSEAGSDSGAGDGYRPKFVMNKSKQQFQQQQNQQSFGSGSFQQSRKGSGMFGQQQNNNNTNDYSGRPKFVTKNTSRIIANEEENGESDRPQFVMKKKQAKLTRSHSNFEEQIDGGGNDSFQPKFEMNKRQSFTQPEESVYQEEEQPSQPQKYIPKHLRQQQQQQQQFQQQTRPPAERAVLKKGGAAGAIGVTANGNERKGPILTKRAPFIPKAYQNMNLGRYEEEDEPEPIVNHSNNSRVKKLNASARANSASVSAMPSRPTANNNTNSAIHVSKTVAAEKTKVRQSQRLAQQKKTESSVAKKKILGVVSVKTHGVGDTRSTFGITEVHWTGMIGMRMKEVRIVN
jgi:hypothetical protein